MTASEVTNVEFSFVYDSVNITTETETTSSESITFPEAELLDSNRNVISNGIGFA